MKIAIASGKGGTGKTTVALNLYYFLSKVLKRRVQLIDCDVEEPNDLLFFDEAEKLGTETVSLPVPVIDTQKCTFCKQCSEWCEFNAITIVKNLKFAEISKDLCHSCGACSVACKFDAINEYPQPIGTITRYQTGFGDGLVEGRLEIGSSMQTALIKALKRSTRQNSILQLFDAPPGTSCPVVETVSGADYVIVVTEPTPFGEYDLKLTVDLLKDLHLPFGVIINKAGLGSGSVYRYLEENAIDLIGEIPFSKAYAERYSKGSLLHEIPAEMEKVYIRTAQKLLKLTGLK